MATSSGSAVTDGAVTDSTPPPSRPTGKRKRGRESVGDMIRSLALVLLVVLVIFVFGRPSSRDEARVRSVDPGPDISSFTSQFAGAPVPRRLPAGWTPTVSDLAGSPEALRIGYNTPGKQYAEYDGVVRPDAKTLLQLVGSTQPLGQVEIAGVGWQRYRDSDGSLSFVREQGPITVVVGGTRASATEAELRVLLGALGTAV